MELGYATFKKNIITDSNTNFSVVNWVIVTIKIKQEF